jgi:hypothetical protein
VLGLQLWIVLPPGQHGGWYWPFVEYPMYSTAHPPTDSVTAFALRVWTCKASAIAVPVTDSLGMPLLGLRSLMASVVSTHTTPSRRAASLNVLSEAIAASTKHRACAAEIVTRSIPVATFDWTARTASWTRAFRWNLTADSADARR